LACAATPPSLTPNVLSKLGKDLCKISEDNLSLDHLSSKGKGKSVIGGKGAPRGTCQTRLTKGMVAPQAMMMELLKIRRPVRR
jgi:hypothetical protein